MTTFLSAWLHNIDPFAIQFTETFGLRWYGLAYITAFTVCWFICQRIRKVGITTLQKREITDFVIIGAIAVVAGGRLGYVLFYKPQLLITFHASLPFWGVFDIQGGGMASHGAMIGVAIVLWWYARRSRNRVDDKGKPLPGHSYLHLLDITTISAAVGFLFGRIANFINGELVGRVCDESYRWAVKFPQDMYDWLGAKWNIEALLSLRSVVEQVGIKSEQWVDAVTNYNGRLVEVTIGKLIAAVQAGGPSGTIVGSAIAPLLTPHHPSQLYAAFLEGFCVLVILSLAWLRPRKPGVIAGLFGVSYGIARIIDEFWRKPDSHIADQEFAAIGITRGQILSIVMVIISIALIWWSARRNVAKMGGLLPVKAG